MPSRCPCCGEESRWLGWVLVFFTVFNFAKLPWMIVAALSGEEADPPEPYVDGPYFTACTPGGKIWAPAWWLIIHNLTA
eukprot:COSAG06_NODE_26574_length_611_cov_18.771484_1_plen_78_part_01